MVLLRQALRIAVITDGKMLRRMLHTNGMDKPQPLWQKRWPMLTKASYTNEGKSESGNAVAAGERQQAVQSDNYQLVIVGTGWAGYQMFTECSKHLADIEKNVGGRNVDIVVVSMRNHFLYTPLLASTTVGTLEFQSITEPIRDGMFRHEGHFHLANVKEIDPEKKELFVRSALGSRREYPIKFDTLVLACGSRPLTFGLPGVEEHAFFLKEIHHAQKIRNRILENFEVATQPGVTPEEKTRLLHFVVVGGGPTGIEFCAELYDLVLQDLRHMYPDVSKYLGVTLLDSGEILSGFDKQLRTVALSKIESRSSMQIIKKNCIEVTADGVTLEGGEKLPAGLVVWTAGVGPNALTKSLTVFDKSKRGNILTNQYCQVLGTAEVEEEAPFGMPRRSNVFSIGDCAEILDYPLPATAQKAQTQADYLTALLRGKNAAPAKPYMFRSKGMMAYIGSYQGLFEARPGEDNKITLSGWQAWFLWRSAYLTKLGSWRLRMQVPLDWLKAILVGRDVSRF
ncbi:Internal alternative NAD(P)H-ubiquinone oxidoreductase A1, mitochondrial [Phytophthora pseudosyringae]|uniref:Internal alternative NAD(P)H-ubiquinone oxidoreductase A1, mitochondrial n=1 Tax=Phytophthora pseudosyringae TaxID=221518 RepID=A0A8T1W044_9STRA|nr:Internal alternative NAD(P)H-ubiquinone oxidoreductase A1, mitochondrial [Phytophthora pseudosyringae]